LVDKEFHGVPQVMVVPKQIDGKTLHYPFVSITYTVVTKDGKRYSDAADCYAANCKDFGMFPTSVAASRAEARVLRKVLGINELAAEEIIPQQEMDEFNNEQPAKPEQIKVIQTKMSRQDIVLKDLLAKITTREVFDLASLTVKEALAAITYLNEVKK
jgi:hypothetical protein